MKDKIAWFTPISNSTGIAKFSKVLLPELTKFFEVDIWTPIDQKEYYDKREIGDVNIIYFESGKELRKNLKEYKEVIYNLGNNTKFHDEIYKVYQKNPGIIILHDFVMLHYLIDFFYKKDLEKNKIYQLLFLIKRIFLKILRITKRALLKIPLLSKSKGGKIHQKIRSVLDKKRFLIAMPGYLKDYLDLVKKTYGDDAAETQKKIIMEKGIEFFLNSELIMKYPLSDYIAKRADSIIIHSDFYNDFLNNSDITNRIKKINFPTPVVNSSSNSLDEIKKEKFLFLSYGHIVPNKYIYEVINVIGELGPDFYNQIEYVIIGNVDAHYLEKINNLIETYKLQGSVKLLGYQDDNVLNDYLQKCDLCINLRYPNAEGASWSVIEQMLNKRLILSFDTGFYAEIPNDCMCKIPLNDFDILKDELRNIINNYSSYEEYKNNAENFAKNNFCTEKYVQSLKEFIYEGC